MIANLITFILGIIAGLIGLVIIQWIDPEYPIHPLITAIFIVLGSLTGVLIRNKK